MEVLVFKTNLQQADDVERVTTTMNEEQRILKWTVDREDCDKVLRVESDRIHADEVAALIRQAGYSCEELTY
jgi:hypothetical protein